MSHDIKLLDPVTKEVIQFDAPHHLTGGTYQMGGCTEAWMNITYNYGEIIHEAFKDLDRPMTNGAITKIYGMTGADTIPVLQKAVDKLRDNVDDNYWNATEGNVKQAFLKLIALAKMRPDGVWDGD